MVKDLLILLIYAGNDYISTKTGSQAHNINDCIKNKRRLALQKVLIGAREEIIDKAAAQLHQARKQHQP